jgi:glycosyltransferase involved in cell wall biosynthesis
MSDADRTRAGAGTLARSPRTEPATEPAAPRRQRSFLRAARAAARSGLEWLLGIRLGHFHCYRPRPLQIPRWYQATQGCNTDLIVSIVTPSYNQGVFLERTIQSVLGQSYPRLEYIIQDGGSSDRTVEILGHHRACLTHCESRRDGGQAHALNLGFRHARGDVLAYLNADDLLLPGAVHYVADFFARHPDVDVVYGHRVLIDENDEEVNRWVLPRHDGQVLAWVDYVPQETLFWRRRIWERVGGRMDETFQFALDWDLLLRFRDVGARFERLPRFLGAFRLHQAQKTAVHMTDWWVAETDRLCQRYQTKVRYPKILPYLLRHALYQKLYQLGILRY